MGEKISSNKNNKRIFLRTEDHRKLKLLSVEHGVSMGELIKMAIPFIENKEISSLPANILNNIKEEKKNKF